jgi:hypothetical protein
MNPQGIKMNPLNASEDRSPSPQDRRRFLLGLAGALAVGQPAWAATGPLPPVDVFKNPSCGCCGAWVDHLKAAGFQVRVTEVTDTAVVRKQQGMPEKFGSCHTARVGGYVLEGHVPAADVKRLLATRPQALGLAVPGMPVGSPGMEDGGRRDAFRVLLIDKAGRDSVFAAYPKA